MPSFDSNDPREFGWSLGFRDFVPYVYKGRLFPQGMHPLFVPVLTHVIGLLEATGEWQLPGSKLGLGCGCWGQEDRMTKSGGAISFHQYGLAADLAAPWNPWQVADPAPSPYRLPDNTSEIVEPFGLLWGGSPRWGNNRDRMHIQCNSSPRELAALSFGVVVLPPHKPTPGIHPYPLPPGCYFGPLSGPNESISGIPQSDWAWRPALKVAQSRLHVVVDGMYGPKTAMATQNWQFAHGLVVDGLIGPNTWRSLMS
jgi:hypothetical protein